MKLAKYQKILLGVVVLGLVVAGGGYASYKGYRAWRQKRLMSQAREFLAAGEERKGLISLKRALSINNQDLEACRMMASLAEARRSQEAILWRQRVVDLNPGSTKDCLALAQTAMMFQDKATATNALQEIPEADRNSAEYHIVAGGIASTLNQLDEAERHFEAAGRLDPNNAFSELNLAVVRLTRTNAQDLAKAESALQTLAANPTNSTLRCRALRELVRHSMRSGETNEAVNLAANLVKESEAGFSDKLLRLDVLGLTRNAEFTNVLAATQIEATNSLANAYEMGVWQLPRIPPRLNLEWLAGLPAEMQTNSAIAMMACDLHVALQDWTGLQAVVEGQSWGGLDFVRRAFKTLALRNQKLDTAAEAEWAQVMRAVGGEKAALGMLLRLSAQWRWPNEVREILWTITGRYPGEKWAANLLQQNLLSSGETRSLLTFFRQQSTATPNDLDLKNNLAMTALLLEASELRPHEMAREVYQAQPTNSSYASTYAFSLHLQEKDTEALQVIEKIDPKRLEDPNMAGYYGLILKATGNAEKAKQFFNRTAEAKLLPEERALFDRAQRGG